MNLEDISKLAQDFFQSRPTIVLGSGASIPHGLPSMDELSNCLQNNVSAQSTIEQKAWTEICNALHRGSFSELLPVLDVGEAPVVGDASLLPTRVQISEPRIKPDSQAVAFWDRWNEEKPKSGTDDSITSWRRQSMN